MRRVLTTFGFGEHAGLLEISLPTFARYAARHGYDLFVPQEYFFRDETKARPYSWWKVPLLRTLLEGGYESVLWVDSDVVIRRHDKDIAEDCGEAPMHMVVHQTEDGSVPNCGVWFVRNSATQFLGEVWGRTGSRREDGWWEQAAVISALGGDADAEKVSVPEGPLWGQLPYEWNPHALDSRGITSDARFFHATMIHDRAIAMRRAIGDQS